MEEHLIKIGIDPKYVKNIETMNQELLDKANIKDPEDIKRVLLRSNVFYWLQSNYDRIYQTIYGSQISLLSHLNGKSEGDTSENLKTSFYDPQAIRFPNVYNTYPFESYISYLVLNGLILQENHKYKITPFGKQFLSYLTNSGKLLNKSF